VHSVAKEYSDLKTASDHAFSRAGEEEGFRKIHNQKGWGGAAMTFPVGTH